ncbi:MAG: 2-isopropylmalate synthase [Myxococcales bacterium]|nr:2-isopropylmalate synthase [Myxococcales bacterium]
MMQHTSLIHDWNDDARGAYGARPITFFDETLRDGLQSPSVAMPSLDARARLLRLMAALGIQSANIGFAAAGGAILADILALGRVIRDERLPVRPTCVGRTTIGDMEPIIGASQELGIAIEAACFIGSSEIRRTIEQWDVDDMQRQIEQTVAFITGHGLEVMFVTEDTTRARPAVLTRLYRTAIDCGARRICACDTVGHATPRGVRSLIRFLRELAGPEILIDWHGHNDRGLALINAIVALEAGADRLEAAGLGIGERCGNTSMDQLLINLKLMGAIDHDLSRIGEYCQTISEAVGIPIPVNYPCVGADAFRTASGVHAAAIVKAQELGDTWLANRVYSGVPAEEFGREQQIEIGPMSGRSNVVHWLRARGLEVDDAVIARVLERAKVARGLLSEDELRELSGAPGA